MNHAWREIPAFNAALSALSAILLSGGWFALKSGRTALARRLTAAAFAASTVLMVCSIFYHYEAGFLRFEDLGMIRPVYFALLLSHRVLALLVGVMILRGMHLIWRHRVAEHERLFLRALPLWLYVSVSGVVLYWMLYHRTVASSYAFGDSVEAAAEAPGAPAWAGTYYDDGGNHGADEVVTLSTAGYDYGFTFSRRSEDWGSVELAGDGVLLLRPGGWWPAKTLRLIPWDDRIYAIYDEQKLEFINHVNEYLGPKERGYVWQMPYRAPEEKRRSFGLKEPRALGLPQVPESWRPLLLERAVEATITKVGAIRYVSGMDPRRIAVELDTGRRKGLVPGQELFLMNFRSATKIIITSVTDDSASGEACQSDYFEPFEAQRLPWVGQKAVSYFVYGDIWEDR